MKITQFLVSLLLSAIALPTLVLGGEDKENDEYGMFYFDASGMDFSDGAIYPKACVSM